MKKIIYILMFFSISLAVGQVRPMKGVILDTLTTAELNALPDLVKKKGSLYYDLTKDTFVTWNNSIWIEIGGSLDPADQTKLDNITITQEVDLDAIEILANGAVQTESDPTVTPASVKSQLESLTDDNRLDALAIKNLSDYESDPLYSAWDKDYDDLINKPSEVDISGKADVDKTTANTIEIAVQDGIITEDYRIIFAPNNVYWGSESGSIEIDETVIENSTNAVSGGGVYDVLQAIDLSVASKVDVTSGVASYANNLLLPDGTTSVKDYGFNNVGITSLILPSSLVSIGNYGFNENNLTSLLLNEGLITIGDYSFSENILNSIDFGSTLTDIGSYAFYNNSLTTLEIPSNIVNIGSNSFKGNDISLLTLNNGLETIGNSAFEYNELISITMPASLTSIGNASFVSNDLTSVSLNDGLVSIGNQAFESNQLTDIVIPNTVTSIGTRVFAYNQLTTFTWSNSVNEIPDQIFIANPFTSVTIPSNVTVIGSNAFADCTSLTTLTVHSGVTEIKTNAFDDTAITDVSLPTGITLGTDAFPTGTTITYY